MNITQWHTTFPRQPLDYPYAEQSCLFRGFRFQPDDSPTIFPAQMETTGSHNIQASCLVSQAQKESAS